MGKKPLVLVAVASLFLAGCPTSNLYPLYSDKDSDTESALVGTWVDQGETPDKGSAKIEKAPSGNNAYTMTITDPAEGATDLYNLRLVRLGATLFADMTFDSRKRTDAKPGTKSSDENVDMPMGMVPLHTVLKLVVKGDDLAMSTMEDDILRRTPATGAPLLAFMDTNGSGVVVTAGTDALRKYVAAHMTDGFSEAVHYQRVH